MIHDINRLNFLIRKETNKAIKAILESSLSQDERDRQKNQSDIVSKRGLNAGDENPSAKDEAEDETKEEKEDKEETEDSKREDRTKGRGTAESPKLARPKKEQLKNPNLSIVVDKINALRGGKSLDDPDVKKSFQQYYDSLSVPEKQSLVLFLTGISRILSGKEAGAEAIDPSDAGLRVKKVQDKSIEKSDGRTKGSKQGTEDNPIVVGESASKAQIMKVLKAYRDNS